MTREIPLTRGLVALVDDEDYDWLTQWKWQAMCAGRNFYASRDVRVGPRCLNQRVRILMHREVVGVGPEMEVDHRNLRTLDNRRENLRAATRAQNVRNRNSHRGSTSRFKGVFWDTQYSAWHARIVVDGKVTFLGRFRDEIEAAKAYDVAAIIQFGEFARPNFGAAF
jgi:hypothetical protein